MMINSKPFWRKKIDVVQHSLQANSLAGHGPLEAADLALAGGTVVVVDLEAVDAEGDEAASQEAPAAIGMGGETEEDYR